MNSPPETQSGASNDSGRKLRVKERRHYTEDCLQDEDIEGKRMFSVEEKLLTDKFGYYFVKEMKGDEFNLRYIQENGFEFPVLIKDKTGLGMRIPSANFTVNDVRQCVGSRRMLDVMDVTTQKDAEMTMKDWCKYYENPARDKLLNVISLEFSHTKLENYVESPNVVRQLDWVDLVWPRHLKESQTESTNSIEEMKYPKVQKYCLMSVKGCFTDFHIDFGGTSVWYHILKGQKVFWLIPPTEHNLNLYEQWVLSGKQGDMFFADTVDKCARIHLQAGYTFFIPTGWIHAVFTPVDSLVFGGNFLQSFGIENQLRVSEIEDTTHVPPKFRYPFYMEIMWYVLQRYVYCLTGKNHLIGGEDSENVKMKIDKPKLNVSDPQLPTDAQAQLNSSNPLSANAPTSNASLVLSATNGVSVPAIENKPPGESAATKGKTPMLLTKHELKGLMTLTRYLQQLPPQKRIIPELIDDEEALLSDAIEMLKDHWNDDPHLSLTGKPTLIWPEAVKVRNWCFYENATCISNNCCSKTCSFMWKKPRQNWLRC